VNAITLYGGKDFLETCQKDSLYWLGHIELDNNCEKFSLNRMRQAINSALIRNEVDAFLLYVH
jgi:hypothetical protein